MKKHTAVLKDIGCAEVPGVVVADHNTSTKISISLRHLISLKSTKKGCTVETVFVSLKRKQNGQFQLLFRTKFRNGAKGAAKHLVACLYKDQKEEAFKIFSVEHQELAKTTHCTSEVEPIYSV